LTQCQGTLYDETPCPRLVITGTPWCIFHHPNKDQELTKQFDDEFPHEYERQISKKVDQLLDFTGFHFPSEMEFKGVLPGCSFKNAVFNKNVSFGRENQLCQINGLALLEFSLFKGDALFFGTNFQKGVNFRGSKFDGSFIFFRVITHDFTSFQFVEFNGFVEFQRSSISKAFFQGTRFNNRTRFEETTFYESTEFRNSIFKESISFDNTVFQGSADFQGVTFEKRADINAVFDKKVTFDGVNFNQLAHFDNSHFNELASFRSSSFAATAAFRRINFNQGVDFTRANFYKDAMFDYSDFKEVSDFDRILIQNTMSFRQITVEGRLNFKVFEWRDSRRIDNTTLVLFNDPIVLEYGKIIIQGTLGKIENNRIKGVSFLNTELEKIEFINEEWPRLNNNIHSRKICIDEYLLELYDTEVLTILHYDVTAQQVGQLYRRLRENYENAKRYSEAGDFLVGEMEMRRKHDPSWYNRQLLRVYKELALYGESLGRPLIWSGLLILLATEYIVLFVEQPKTPTEFISMLSQVMPTVIMSFFPLGQATTFYYFIIKLLGSLLLGTMFIAVRRKLERQ